MMPAKNEKDIKPSVADESAHVEFEEILEPELEGLLLTEPLKGLSNSEAELRLAKFGKNEIQEKKVHPLIKFLLYFTGPISYLLELAAIVSGSLQDWPDFGILVGVLLLNAVIGFAEEAKAENALDALKNTLALKCKVFREGLLVEVESVLLVPGDIITLRLGDIIPADCRLLGLGVSGDVTEAPLQIDQSALTGESLPVDKKKGATAYSSSIVKQGQMLAVVTKTGAKTFIGRAANLMLNTHEQGHFQKIINTIGNFLIIISVVMCVIIFIYEVFKPDREKPLEALRLVLVILVAAIPVGMQTVLTVTMAVGAKQLAEKEVIVKRLTAIEELASVSILCSDKTGTITLNELSFDKPYLTAKGNTDMTSEESLVAQTYTENDLLLTAYFASEPGATDAIELATRRGAESKVEILKTRAAGAHDVPGYKVVTFIPFNPVTKYTEATIQNIATGEKFRCIKGAPHVILEKCNGHEGAENAVLEFARQGLRALGVAKTVDDDMKTFEMVGLISLMDPPRPDSAATIKECIRLGVQVKMITGDQLVIAKEVAKRLDMPRTILDAHKLADPTMTEESLIERVVKADGFAQVIPEHKFKVVELLQKKGYLVGMTGDGVNDAPALKKANVGIAVHGCTDAARSAADIVLLAPGLSTIVDGILCSRAIFQRMRSYAIYRITSTIHFLLFFFISILAFDFYIPERLLILIAVLNDAATLVISVDNAKISGRPDKWRLGQLLTLSFILGVLLMGISFAHFFLARALIEDDPLDPHHKKQIIQTIMYLQISSCPHFVIFSTRLPGWFWENSPSLIFIIAVGGTQLFAMFMSIYGLEALQAVPIGWAWGIGVMSVSIVSFMLLDIVKVFIIRNWSFELTARLWPSKENQAKLKERIQKEHRLDRVKSNTVKIKKAAVLSSAVAAFSQGLKKKDSVRIPSRAHSRSNSRSTSRRGSTAPAPFEIKLSMFEEPERIVSERAKSITLTVETEPLVPQNQSQNYRIEEPAIFEVPSTASKEDTSLLNESKNNENQNSDVQSKKKKKKGKKGTQGSHSSISQAVNDANKSNDQ